MTKPISEAILSNYRILNSDPADILEPNEPEAYTDSWVTADEYSGENDYIEHTQEKIYNLTLKTITFRII